MFARIFEEPRGKKLNRNATFAARVQAKLSDYLKPFDAKCDRGVLERGYAVFHGKGEARALAYQKKWQRLIDAGTDEQQLQRVVFNDLYAKKTFDNSKTLRRYLEAALFEHHQEKILGEVGGILRRTVDAIIKEQEESELVLLNIECAGWGFPAGSVQAALKQARVTLLQPCIEGEGASVIDAIDARKSERDTYIQKLLSDDVALMQSLAARHR